MMFPPNDSSVGMTPFWLVRVTPGPEAVTGIEPA